MMTLDRIITKMPFRRILPDVYRGMTGYTVNQGESTHVPQPDDYYITVSQSDFLREYYPSGHKIHDPTYYMDRIKEDDKGNKYIHYVERVAFPLQQVVTTKQLTHLCGNQIEFSNSNTEKSVNQQAQMQAFRQAWIKKNMEIHWYEAAKSEKITGDTAIAGYFDEEGQFGCRVFTFLNGDTLLPHYNKISGKMDIFGRMYKAYDVDGESVLEEFLEVWDNKYVSTYVKKIGGSSSVKRIANNIRRFVQGDWDVVGEPREHGFPFLPIGYKRNLDGACWSSVQSSIDQFEKAVSQLCENNKVSAFRILYLQGDSVDIQYDSSGQPTAIVGDSDTDAKYLDKADISTAFDTQLKLLTQNIFMGSFTVLPPEVKGGDLAGVTIKLLYSPAVEKAISDSKEWDSFIDTMVKVFKHGYGAESKNSFNFATLDIKGEIKPYVHQNDQEVINNINSSVLSGSLSQETAGEIHPYAATDEVQRLKKEAREKIAAEVNSFDGSNEFNKAEEEIAKKI